MPRKITRKGLTKKADNILSLYVRARDGKCVVCGRRDTLQAGHLFSRGARSTRWDLRNVWTQCAGCNILHTYDPIPYYNWYKQRFGEDSFNELYRDFKQIRKWTDTELLQLIQDITNSLKDLE